MKNFKPFFWFIFGLPVLLVLGVIYVSYGLSQEFVLPPDGHEYKVTADISELRLEKPIPTFYYIDSNGLSIKTPEESKSKQIFEKENIIDFFLLEPSQKVVVFTEKELYVIEKDGKNPILVFTSPKYSLREKIYVSPQEDKIVFFLPAKQPYIFNVKDNSVKQISIAQNNLEKRISKDVYWFENNIDFFWISGENFENTTYTTRVIKINTDTNQSILLRQFKDHENNNEWMQDANIAELVSPEKLVLPVRDINDPWIRLSRPVYTPDGKHHYEIKHRFDSSKLFVDGKQLLQWSAKKNGQYSHVKQFQWFDDSHLIFLTSADEGKNQLRILELSTHKIAVFFAAPDSDSTQSRYQVKWFGQKDYLPQPEEW